MPYALPSCCPPCHATRRHVDACVSSRRQRGNARSPRSSSAPSTIARRAQHLTQYEGVFDVQTFHPPVGLDHPGCGMPVLAEPQQPPAARTFACAGSVARVRRTGRASRSSQPMATSGCRLAFWRTPMAASRSTTRTSRSSTRSRSAGCARTCEAGSARRFEFYLNPDFAGGTLVVQDAYLDTIFSPAFRIRAGKGKTPFGFERLHSASNMLFLRTRASHGHRPQSRYRRSGARRLRPADSSAIWRV